jgi:hypothetical protein
MFVMLQQCVSRKHTPLTRVSLLTVLRSLCSRFAVHAVLQGKLAAVKYLLKRGADVTIPEKDGWVTLPSPHAGCQHTTHNHDVPSLYERARSIERDQPMPTRAVFTSDRVVKTLCKSSAKHHTTNLATPCLTTR